MKDLVSTVQRHEVFGTPIDDEIGGNLGTLSSDIRVQLHTKQALKLFLGAKIEGAGNKRPDGSGYSIPGIGRFSRELAIIDKAIRADDPYADMIYYQLHEDIIAQRAELKQKADHLKTWLENKLPPGISMTASINSSPAVHSVKLSGPLAFELLYWILSVDEYIRTVMLARHVAVIDAKTASDATEGACHAVRSVITRVSRYRYTDVTRNDIAANNERARNAAAIMPNLKLTEEFATGTTRSRLAPPISNRPEVSAESMSIADINAEHQAA